MAYKEFSNISKDFKLPTEIPEEHSYLEESKRWKRKIEAETKRLALAGKVFASGMSGYDAWMENLKYYSKGGRGYASALKDYRMGYAEAYSKKYNLGLTGRQLFTNPQLASDPRALAEYTGKPYGGVDYTPGSADWYKLHPEEIKKGEVKPPFTVHPDFNTTPVPPYTTQYGPSDYTGVSIVDYLKSVGQASDYSSRAQLAQQLGIVNYTGTAEQNTRFLSILRGQAPTEVPPTGVSLTAPPAKDEPAIRPPWVLPGEQWRGGETEAQHLAKRVGEDEQARNDAAALANQNAQTIFDNLPGTDIDMRKSATILEDIQTKLEETEEKIPAPMSLVDLFQAQKVKLGIDVLETELADIDADIERINTELLVQAEEAGEKLISTREIGRAKGVLQKRADREIALLNVERSAVARILGNKVDTLNAIVGLTDMDYDNASDYYTKEYNRQVQLYNLVSGAEERELTHAERARDDAQANLIIIQNSLEDGNLTYDSLTADQKLKISQLEIQAGFPSGLTSQIMTDEPDKKIQTVTSRTDESGNTYYDVLLVDPDGAMSVNSIFRGKAAPAGKEGEITSVETTLLESKKGGEYVDGNVYLEQRRKSTLGPDEFNKRFGDLLSPGDRKKYGIKRIPGEEEIDPVLLKDLKDAISVIEQGADEDEVKRRFLEKHPNDEKLYNNYVGL